MKQIFNRACLAIFIMIGLGGIFSFIYNQHLAREAGQKVLQLEERYSDAMNECLKIEETRGNQKPHLICGDDWKILAMESSINPMKIEQNRFEREAKSFFFLAIYGCLLVIAFWSIITWIVWGTGGFKRSVKKLDS